MMLVQPTAMNTVAFEHDGGSSVSDKVLSHNKSIFDSIFFYFFIYSCFSNSQYFL